MRGVFTARIRMGNDAIKTKHDLCMLLGQIRSMIRTDKWHGSDVVDLNGNTVGEWEITRWSDTCEECGANIEPRAEGVCGCQVEVES